MNDSGTLSITHNKRRIATRTGHGSASWSTSLDAGGMPQGKHKYTATACDSKGICSSFSQTITINNTPALSVEVGKAEGDMQISGSVDFKNHPGGAEGRIDIYLKDQRYRYARFYRHGRKWFEGDQATSWTYKDIVGHIFDAGGYADGKYTLRVTATAANGATKTVDKVITINNTPEITIIEAVYYDDATFDIIGTATFKDYAGGAEGSIRIDIKDFGKRYGYHGRRVYEGKNIAWKYSDITGHRLDKFTWGAKEITVKATARAHNGTTTKDEKELIIPALGCPQN